MSEVREQYISNIRRLTNRIEVEMTAANYKKQTGWNGMDYKTGVACVVPD